MMPAEVTVAILQHVSQRQRLGQCALVCRSWLAAAVAATNGISTQPTRPADIKSLSRWLQHHGSGLTYLSIVFFDYECQHTGHVTLETPFSCLRQLRELHLSGLSINTSSSGSSSSSSFHSGRWADLTALTYLHLDRVTLYNSGDGSAFNSIRSLRQLVLSSIDSSNQGLPSLAPLTQLTCLVLEHSSHMTNRVQGTGHLSRLVRLEPATHYDIQVLSSTFPLSLVRLDLGRPGPETATWEITTMTAPRLSELTALEHLEVQGDEYTCFDSQLLSNLVQLRHLSLGGCQMTCDGNAVEGVATLLAVLPRLSTLQHLDLAKSMAYPVEAVQQYSALVSSAALTHLDLRDCWLQENAVLYMFKDQQCPALQHLRLGADEFRRLERFEPRVLCYARSNALDALVAACPTLQELQLLDTVMDPACWGQLSALGHLADLSKLALAGDVICDESIRMLTSLALPALRDLDVVKRGKYETTFTADWVMHLAEFTQLTRLELQLNRSAREMLISCTAHLGTCANDQHLLFSNKDGLTNLLELFDAALPASERARKIEERARMIKEIDDSIAEKMQLLQYYPEEDEDGYDYEDYP